MQLLVGLVVSRGIRSESDYLLAGRRLGYALAIFSISARWFGAKTRKVRIARVGAVLAGVLAHGLAFSGEGSTSSWRTRRRSAARECSW